MEIKNLVEYSYNDYVKISISFDSFNQEIQKKTIKFMKKLFTIDDIND